MVARKGPGTAMDVRKSLDKDYFSGAQRHDCCFDDYNAKEHSK